jgi:anti-sigma factor RsiW
MTPNFNPHNNDSQPAPLGSSSSVSGSLPALQRDRFELLSAYIDGEVTAAERKQVEEWLAHDATMQRLHSQLLKLHHSFQALPVPATETSVERTVEQVLARVDRKPRATLFWGGAAIAALFIGGLTTLVSGDRGLIPSLATRSSDAPTEAPLSAPATSEPLLVALDRPLVTIPKTAVAEPNAAPADSTPEERSISTTQ